MDPNRAETYYSFTIQNGVLYLTKAVADTFTILAQQTQTVSVGDILSIQCSGTSIIGVRNGTTVLSATDSTITNGQPGIYGSMTASSGTTGCLANNWIATPLTQIAPTKNYYKARAYWRQTGTTLWNFAAETANRSQTSISFPLPWNLNGQQIDVQLRSVLLDGSESNPEFSPTYTYTVTSQLPSQKLFTDGTSTFGFTASGGKLSVGSANVADSIGNIQLKNISIATTSGQSTSSTTPSIVAGLSISITTKGNPVHIIATVQAQYSVAGGAPRFVLWRDGTPISDTFEVVANAANSTYTVTMHDLDQPSAGAHTYAVAYFADYTNPGTVTAVTGTIQAIELG